MKTQVTYKFDADTISEKLQSKHKQYLHEIGVHTVNQAVEEAPYLTGALRNSIIYKLSDNSGSVMNRQGGKPASSDAVMTKSENKDYVKIGSALVYARRREYEGKGAGYLARTLDIIQSGNVLERIAKAVFRW